ncbi:MAG TPA: phosphate/phosphite/phosphonate ABC transporter substrate-binding protein [Candidatus Binatia bacterium]|jgi:phosphonate transport system substrate-binding protein|nr:phosphate/phosphite/phosphonate ABC transporter substrate-binding protein [Candidatus Binatia bacterium]
MQFEVHASFSMAIMMRRQTRELSVLAAIAALVCGFAVASAEAQAPEKMKAQTVSLGIVTQLDRKRMADQFSDFVRYVAAKLTSASGIEGKVVIAATSFELARLIEQKQVDFYMESPYPTHLINNVQGVAKLRLRRWKGGSAEYQSLIFTKRDGEINRLEDLRGKILAFEDPESTSGHFLPKSFLIRKGFKFTDKNRYDLYASSTDVGYLFAYSQENLVNWVLTKKAAAAAFSDDDYARLEKRKRSDITILAETEQLPRHFLSVRKDFPPALADRLEKILVSMHENEQGRRILKKADDTTKFDPLPEGDEALRRRLSEIFDSAKKS